MQEYSRSAVPRDSGLRLDAFWARELADEGVSRGRVKAWIEAGGATLDGRVVTKPGQRLTGAEVLVLRGALPPAGAGPEAGVLPVVHEDERLIVVAKPAGVSAHPAPGVEGPTVVGRLLARYPELSAEASGMDPERPGIVHRLDKDTTGLMAVARDEAARLQLAEDFAERRVAKAYLALVHGVPGAAQNLEEGVIDAPLGRDSRNKTRMAVVPGGREARSAWRVLWRAPDDSASLVLVRIFTGRTHQIRVHLAHIGHPLLGDATYGAGEHARWQGRGDAAAHLAARQMLHAFRLELTHPGSGEPLRFVLPPPEDFQRLMQTLERRCLRVGVTGLPGSGKSALTGILAELGAPVFSADACVAELYVPGGDAASLMAARFGGRFTTDDGGVDKAALLAAMREDEGLRREVMDLVHPLVEHRAGAFFAEHSEAPFAAAEVPLLVEADWPARGLVDVAVYVDCPDAERRRRLTDLRGVDADTVAALESWQWPGEAKRAACGFVADNAGDHAALRREAGALAETLRLLAAEREAAFAQRQDALWAEAGEMPYTGALA